MDGSDRLHLESVTHEVTQAPESEVLLHSSNSQRRKFWKRHRELLKEQMRQKRLEQYEARMKEQELETGHKQCKTSVDGKVSFTFFYFGCAFSCVEDKTMNTNTFSNCLFAFGVINLSFLR